MAQGQAPNAPPGFNVDITPPPPSGFTEDVTTDTSPSSQYQLLAPRPVEPAPPAQTASQRARELASEAWGYVKPFVPSGRELFGYAGGALGGTVTLPAEVAPGVGAAIQGGGILLGYQGGTHLYDILASLVGYDNIPAGITPEYLATIPQDAVPGVLLATGPGVSRFAQRAVATPFLEGLLGQASKVAGMPGSLAKGGLGLYVGHLTHGAEGGAIGAVVSAIMESPQFEQAAEPVRKVVIQLINRGETEKAATYLLQHSQVTEPSGPVPRTGQKGQSLLDTPIRNFSPRTIRPVPPTNRAEALRRLQAIRGAPETPTPFYSQQEELLPTSTNLLRNRAAGISPVP